MDFMGLITKKDMVSTVYFLHCQLLQFSLKNCFVAENLRQTERYAEKNSIILTPKLNLSTEEYKAGHPLYNKSFIDFTDLFRSVQLIFRIFSFDFSLKC